MSDISSNSFAAKAAREVGYELDRRWGEDLIGGRNCGTSKLDACRLRG